jgi:hypothetical protein
MWKPVAVQASYEEWPVNWQHIGTVMLNEDEPMPALPEFIEINSVKYKKTGGQGYR